MAIKTSKRKTNRGVKYDQNKPRMDLLDPTALVGWAEVMSFGATKYGDHNWRLGIKTSKYIAASYRHLTALNSGETIDPESGKPHAYHLMANAAMLAWTLKNKPELDDRWKS